MKFTPFSQRHISRDHLNALNNPLHMRYSRHSRTQWSREDALKWLEKETAAGGRVYAIILDGKTVGSFTLRFSVSTVDVSFMVYPGHTGKSIATQVVTSVLRLLTLPTSFSRVTMGCSVNNEPVIRIARKLNLRNYSSSKGYAHFDQIRGTLFHQ